MEFAKRWSLSLLFLVLFVGCGTARPLMPVSKSLEATSEAMQVRRKQASVGPLSFGEWQVSNVRKIGFPSRTKWGMGIEPISFSKSKGLAEYRFVMTPNERDPWECNCQFERNRRDLGLGRLGETELTYEESLACDLQRIGDDAVWKLRVAGSLAIGGKGYTGTLTQGSRSLSLESPAPN